MNSRPAVFSQLNQSAIVDEIISIDLRAHDAGHTIATLKMTDTEADARVGVSTVRTRSSVLLQQVACVPHSLPVGTNVLRRSRLEVSHQRLRNADPSAEAS